MTDLSASWHRTGNRVLQWNVYVMDSQNIVKSADNYQIITFYNYHIALPCTKVA